MFEYQPIPLAEIAEIVVKLLSKAPAVDETHPEMLKALDTV